MNETKEKKIVEKIEQTLWDRMDIWNIRSAINVLYGENEKENRSLTELLRTAIEEIVEEYNESMDAGDYASEYADSNSPTYNSDILDWYSKDPRRVKYADDGIAEFGRGNNGGVLEVLQLGIYMCLEQFAVAVLEVLEELNEDNEDEDEEE